MPGDEWLATGSFTNLYKADTATKRDHRTVRDESFPPATVETTMARASSFAFPILFLLIWFVGFGLMFLA